MKKSKAGLVLIIIGVVFIALAPIWKWGLGPMLVKLPDNIDSKSTYEGVLTLNVDPNSLQLLPPEIAVKVPLTINRTDVSAPERSSGGVAVVKETAVAKGPGGKDFLTSTKYYALDRKTGKNVTSDEADVKNRTDYSILFGFNVEKKPYLIWDDDTRKSGAADFVEVKNMDGFKFKNIELYAFGAKDEAPNVIPPLGLPEKISGSQIKTLLSNPALPFNDTEMYKVDYIKAVEATVMVDQRAGVVVNLPSFQETYYVDASAMGMGKIKLGSLKYHQTASSVKESIDTAADAYKLLDIVEKYIPLVLLVIGLIILIIGLILFLRKKPAAA